MEYKAPN